ncbi:sensor histidine kinase [Clostridium sp. Marseille-P2415]|uniref:sensor histidine kinase n=1 Tax=Clostridium sp. Marseille-P2415 TaxID=1805471 RepID=UPI0009886F3D|nr:sensor histidine kinase [Clostridium sp. Marseille-P2415]
MLEFIFTLLESSFLYWMINKVLICKFTGKKKVLLLSTAILIDSLFVYICPIELTILRILTFTIFSFILIHVLFNNNYLIKIFFVFLNNYIFLVSDMIAGNLLSWIYEINVDYLISKSLSLFLLSKIIAFLLVLSLIRIFKKINLNISINYWITMNFIMVIFIVLMNFFMTISSTLQKKNSHYTVQIVRISLLFLIMSVIVIYLFGEICFFYQKEQHRYALKLRNKELEQQLAFQESSASDLRKIRHDIKNNLANISYLLKENHIEESVKYINAITSTLEATKSVIHCGNNYIDSIINYEILLCKRNRINIQFEVDNIPDLNIKPTDISSIISNILNNAIEANSKLTESERYIGLKIFCYKNYLTMIVKNPYKHILFESDGILTTNKKDSIYHGYGLKIVKSSVNQYGGTFQYSHDNDVFAAKIILPLSQDLN